MTHLAFYETHLTCVYSNVFFEVQITYDLKATVQSKAEFFYSSALFKPRLTKGKAKGHGQVYKRPTDNDNVYTDHIIN